MAKEVTMWEAGDGKRFDTEQEATEYESQHMLAVIANNAVVEMRRACSFIQRHSPRQGESLNFYARDRPEFVDNVRRWLDSLPYQPQPTDFTVLPLVVETDLRGKALDNDFTYDGHRVETV